MFFSTSNSFPLYNLILYSSNISVFILTSIVSVYFIELLKFLFSSNKLILLSVNNSCLTIISVFFILNSNLIELGLIGVVIPFIVHI